MWIFRALIIIVLLSTVSTFVSAQAFGYGFTAKTDIYQRYANPKDDIAARSAGSFLLNLGVGPKLWVGGEKFSFSAEATANIAPFALALSDYKGLGAGAFPVIGKLNFGGLSSLNREGKFGFSIGGGIQWSRTELFGLKDRFSEQGVERKLFKTYIGEVSYGFGMSGFAIQAFLRVGIEPDTDANTINFGIAYDFNLPRLKELTDPEF